MDRTNEEIEEQMTVDKVEVLITALEFIANCNYF